MPCMRKKKSKKVEPKNLTEHEKIIEYGKLVCKEYMKTNHPNLKWKKVKEMYDVDDVVKEGMSKLQVRMAVQKMVDETIEYGRRLEC